MLRLAITLALSLALGCGEIHQQPPRTELAIAADPACWDEHWDSALEIALQLWSEWDVWPSSGGVPVTLCLVAEVKGRRRYRGWTQSDGDGFLVQLDADLPAPQRAVILAHELGHVVLPGTGMSDHLPDGDTGVMSQSPPDSVTWWTPDDAPHLEYWGLARAGHQ